MDGNILLDLIGCGFKSYVLILETGHVGGNSAFSFPFGSGKGFKMGYQR
jgi:hypothetical protein